MGVVNLTPDSFSDGGRYASPDAAVAAALQMVDDGARMIDLGGESTRPGAETVDAATQLARVMPVLEALRSETDAILSVDTGDPQVLRTVADAGADLINDVYALRHPGALAAAAGTGAAVCLMHMQGEPRTMQAAPAYAELPGDVIRWLDARIAACVGAGIDRERILVDPGFGFGKTDRHNLELLAGLGEFAKLGCPVLVGLSRKSMLGRLTGRGIEERLAAGLAAAVLAVERGAAIVRTHDVPATVDALRIVSATQSAGSADA